MNMDKIEELEQKLQRYKSIFLRYFADETIEEFLEGGTLQNLSGQNIEVSMLFFDLRGSTAIAEKLEPIVFSEFLSELFTDVMDLIYGNGGSVNKMIGDGILATFGCPSSKGDDTYQCVKTALQIREYLHTFNDVRPDYLQNDIRCGVGIATGQVFAGSIGSIRRMEYTVLGDAVNVAARLETLTKELKHDILIDGNTYNKLVNRIGVEKAMLNRVKGKTETLEIFKLLRLLEE
ncbi:MAG: adenylate/guanylate cyclase domain-containing protein [Sulfurimonas sp.]|nr:adenylate/guanylate cyclase domain-containing protein [Sulfurimonas sp.]